MGREVEGEGGERRVGEEEGMRKIRRVKRKGVVNV